MKKLPALLILISLSACGVKKAGNPELRFPVDSVGFATKAWQMDSLINRIDRQYGNWMDSLELSLGINSQTAWRVAISPHDDYTYVGPLYPLLLKHVKAKTVFLFGVAHKAAQLGLEDQIVFGEFPAWMTPYGKKAIPELREELIGKLPEGTYIINDTMEAMEHSLEALVPFLEYYDQDVTFVPILVPYMSHARMEEIARPLSGAIAELAEKRDWQWGKDYAVLISTDAVHYGDEDWGGRNYAPYGTDSTGYRKAVAYEHEIMDSCLAGPLSNDKIARFTRYTVQEGDYRQYKWTWCGRYSVPLGLLTALYLQQDLGAQPLDGVEVGYLTSIDHESFPVKDIGMGVTAPAKPGHWVGYAAIGYK